MATRVPGGYNPAAVAITGGVISGITSLDMAGNITASTTNAYDIGQSAGNRFRNLSLSGVANVQGVIAALSNSAAVGGGAQALQIGSTTARGIYWGSGAPTISAGQGSLYIRSDGSSTSTRAYVNTDGATTWTSFTTAA